MKDMRKHYLVVPPKRARSTLTYIGKAASK
ncbi:hypothetical protein Q667_17980 [Marinobacter sp. C1S70]|jgi:hypothetical protein|nr:hypothetical protein Q667_17980 [Marinobacter sp. C1S70]